MRVALALHVGRGTHAASIGVYPDLGMRYTADEVGMQWGGQLVVQSSQLPRLE